MSTVATTSEKKNMKKVQPGKTYGKQVAAEVETKAKAASTNKAAVASKAKRAARVMYPGLGLNAAGNRENKLTEWPEDHDPKVHLPLVKKDFVTEAPWLVHRAEQMEHTAAKLREQAVLSAKFGNAKDRAKAKKLLSMRETMARLEADLLAQGIDVAALEAETETVGS
jgi:hypothetical protein